LYAGAILILPLEIPVFLKFIAVTAFTGIFCYLIYEFILRRVIFLRPLFGLKLYTADIRQIKTSTSDLK
jgi:hypothetical protein